MMSPRGANGSTRDANGFTFPDIYSFINQRNHCDLIVDCLEEQTKKHKHIGFFLKEPDSRLFFSGTPAEDKINDFLENKKLMLFIGDFYNKWNPVLNNTSFEEIKSFIKFLFSGIENNERWRKFWASQKELIANKKSDFDAAPILEQIAGGFFYKTLSVWLKQNEPNELLKLKYEVFTKSAHFEFKKVEEIFSTKLKREIQLHHNAFLGSIMDLDKKELIDEYSKMIEKIKNMPLFKIMPHGNVILSNYCKEFHEKINIISPMALEIAEEGLAASMKTSNRSSRSPRSPIAKRTNHQIIKSPSDVGSDTSPRQDKMDRRTISKKISPEISPKNSPSSSPSPSREKLKSSPSSRSRAKQNSSVSPIGTRKNEQHNNDLSYQHATLFHHDEDVSPSPIPAKSRKFTI